MGDTRQPIVEPTEVESRSRRQMLQVGARLSHIPGPAQPHPANGLSMDPFDSGSLSIELRKLLSSLALTCGL